MNKTLDKTSRIYVAGHNGLVGSAIVRALRADGYDNLLLRSREELDLLDQAAVSQFMHEEKPDFMFVAAAKVGGIYANNTFPAEFIHDNLMIEINLIHSAYTSGMQHLIFLGSSCIYPRECPQPMKEEYLLSGPLEKTNEAYAIAKIAGIKLCESYNRQYGTRYLSLMPTNLYGPGDNFDLENSHVLPALIRKTYEAVRDGKDELIVWGTGKPKREFMYVDDLADACRHFMQWLNEQDENQPLPVSLINIGTGKDISIGELADQITNIFDFKGEINYDNSKPDGTPRKLLDVSVANKTGWAAKTTLKQGVINTIEWLKEHYDEIY